MTAHACQLGRQSLPMLEHIRLAWAVAPLRKDHLVFHLSPGNFRTVPPIRWRLNAACSRISFGTHSTLLGENQRGRRSNGALSLTSVKNRAASRLPGTQVGRWPLPASRRCRLSDVPGSRLCDIDRPQPRSVRKVDWISADVPSEIQSAILANRIPRQPSSGSRVVRPVLAAVQPALLMMEHTGHTVPEGDVTVASAASLIAVGIKVERSNSPCHYHQHRIADRAEMIFRDDAISPPRQFRRERRSAAAELCALGRARPRQFRTKCDDAILPFSELETTSTRRPQAVAYRKVVLLKSRRLSPWPCRMVVWSSPVPDLHLLVVDVTSCFEPS